MAYIDNRYQFEHISEWDLCTPDVEMLWFKLILKLTRPTYVCVCYRPPDGSLDSYIETLQSSIEQNIVSFMLDVIFVGDFNVDVSRPSPAKWKTDSFA